jgi:hypothetical protein
MNMQTGFGGDGSAMAEQYVKSMIDIMTPVMERSMILAAEYSKACGRDTLLPEDLEYAMKYCAMYTVGQTIGSLMPEIYDEDLSDDEEDEEEEDDENLPEFVRYSGDDETFNQMNQAYDRWDSWVPQSPIEEMLKNAINSNEHLGA